MIYCEFYLNKWEKKRKKCTQTFLIFCQFHCLLKNVLWLVQTNLIFILKLIFWLVFRLNNRTLVYLSRVQNSNPLLNIHGDHKANLLIAGKLTFYVGRNYYLKKSIFPLIIIHHILISFSYYNEDISSDLLVLILYLMS